MMNFSKSQIDSISRLTGLKDITVRDLLESGWMYTETLNQTPKWQKPGSVASAESVGLNASYRKIFFKNNDEANDTLRELLFAIKKRGQVSVSDLFGLVHITPTFLEHQWGWKSLMGARVTKELDLWVLKLPEPEFIDY